MGNDKIHSKIPKEYCAADQKDWGRSVCTNTESSESVKNHRTRKNSESYVPYDSI